MIEPGYILSERYKLLKTLGEGGMANVYLAHDLILDRDVAVKVLRLDLQNDPDTKRRFQREAMATTELVHPNIVSIYDVGESNDQQYLVMEYVRGSDLKKYIVEHFPIPYQRVVDIMEQILAGIQVAHDHNIIHRDLKPQNIMIDENGNAKITDFGIAVALSDNSMTQTNSLLGSVHYLSPEQARGSMPTKQSDIYALGIILFEMLTGTVPFEGDSAVSIALKHFQEEMPSVRDFDPRIPQALENVVLKATTKDPANRYTSASAMAADLKTSLSSARAHEAKFVPDSNDLDETKIVPVVSSQTATPVAARSEAQAPQTDAKATKAKPKRKGGWKKWWPAIVLGVLLVGLITMLILAFSGGKGDATVPDLTGMSQTQAESALEAANLELGNVTKASSNTVAKNKVIRSNPASGANLKSGRKVAIVLSTGKKRYTLKDYTGEKYSTVKKKLEKVGFDVKADRKSSDTVPAGEIMDQSEPEGKRLVAKGTELTFTVSSGPKTVKLPSFLGQSENYFNTWMTAHGLTPQVSQEYSDTVASGNIISQNPDQGTAMSKGDTVSVVISKGVDPAKSSASSSSSEAQTQTVTRNLTISYQAPSGESSGSGSSASNQITIYIQDSKHSLSDVFKTMTISSDTTVQLQFQLNNGDTGAYRVMNNGQVVQSEDNIGG
ncbi:MAG: Stk1 family PASTA domain-containing Ser/Thr kinase [Lactobacillus sp.]|jgi:serine/threonine-protein kinase|uniref:non-specific serine/threonine protein kinase n=1 Tax=Lacticaseibacillus suilingensis TaxID=2799577 RepID=A0ABW4BFB3_9LACO|nr:Stk1 family PASTA domain-containing Ser/Thr kinase [Lacticaseibacillus suilingensis]MCI1894583.1 Stk1 family PASTA domain-containing Ser/Thr kinase [Lactobacillus sp.]MCI1940709.1 Stk1 family PASTA domain-containing Ser/Thr kinase [Lactobacillus sp.]MCI1971395.1 Stk1 family PASTA domain-containing Ser/Thr kinase [Lactobacillus sp.]